MFRKRNFFLVFTCGVTIFLIFTFISINVLTKWETLRYNAVENNFEEKIWKIYHNLPKIYYENLEAHNVDDFNGTSIFLKNIALSYNKSNLTYLWKHINNNISRNNIHPQNEYLGTLLKAMQTAKIVEADLDKRGTQLKLLLILEVTYSINFTKKIYI